MKIEDYGFISDLESGALVGRNGSIDWWCVPRFDSGACFARLLGEADHGFWSIAPAEGGMARRRSYLGDSLILVSEFETADGAVVRLTDFLAQRANQGPVLVRIVEGVRGETSMEMELRVRYDYGEMRPLLHKRDRGVVATRGPDAMELKSEQAPEIRDGGRVCESFTLREGERRSWLLGWYPSHEKAPIFPEAGEALEKAVRYWEHWIRHFDYRGEWEDAVKQSAIVLKGLTYRPTGGVLAAATMGLPEDIGGMRNWDYRYCWLRDAALTLDALMDAGFMCEAAAWRDWLVRTVGGSPRDMQIVYGLAGERQLPERELTHLGGYEGSRPVLAGNGAADQFQLDIYGQVLDAMFEARKAGLPECEDAWAVQHELAEFVADNWREKDEGIWEVREACRHFTHSKLMAWVALDRAIRSSEEHGMNGELDKWRRVRADIHREVCERGFNKKVGAFTIDFERPLLDASLLLIPMTGFLPGDDERVRSTVAAIERELMRGGFVYRYDPDRAKEIDGLPPGEGSFLLCSFWMVDAMNMTGRRKDARELFERLLALRNDLGLLSEEYDPVKKRFLGNFPQAFSHVGLINSACNLMNEGRSCEARGRDDTERSNKPTH